MLRNAPIYIKISLNCFHLLPFPIPFPTHTLLLNYKHKSKFPETTNEKTMTRHL